MTDQLVTRDFYYRIIGPTTDKEGNKIKQTNTVARTRIYVAPEVFLCNISEQYMKVGSTVQAATEADWNAQRNQP